MPIIDAVFKLFATIFMFAFVFLMGSAIMMLVVVVMIGLAVSSLLGKLNLEVVHVDEEVAPKDSEIYIREMTVYVDGRECNAQVMYSYNFIQRTFDILSIVVGESDLTETITSADQRRIIVELEMTHEC